MLYSSFLYRTFKLSAKNSLFASICHSNGTRYRELETKTSLKEKVVFPAYANHRNLIQNFLGMIWGELECTYKLQRQWKWSLWCHLGIGETSVVQMASHNVAQVGVEGTEEGEVCTDNNNFTNTGIHLKLLYVPYYLKISKYIEYLTMFPANIIIQAIIICYFL